MLLAIKLHQKRCRCEKPRSFNDFRAFFAPIFRGVTKRCQNGLWQIRWTCTFTLCAVEWSFRAISYRFVHRRTSRFGSRFWSKRDFKNMVELFSQKSARKSSEIKRFRSFYGGQYRTRTCDPMHVKSHPFVFFCILICTYFR